ncbi:MAG TPA: ubiquinone/menaquinone biosynthesis methyltransferase [Acidimicrobiales bacterium]|nr:ubiquinone/menaquinone biosynthesis methyltransferase [Acidimicrobiales bacterium]
MTGASGATALPQGSEKVRAVDRMFDAIAPRYDLLNRLLTFGMDVRWRKKAVRSLDLGAGSTVLDVGCGTGDLCRVLGAAGHHAVGIDRSGGMLAGAQGRRSGGAALVRGDGTSLPVGDHSVDGIVSGFTLRNLVSLAAFLDECGRAVRPGGRIALLEVSTPTNPVLRAGHGAYFGRVVPFVGGLLSDRAAYSYLPKSVAYLPPDDEIVAMVGRAGFQDVHRRALSVGIAQLITGTRSAP